MEQPTKSPLFKIGKVFSESEELTPAQSLARSVGELLIRGSTGDEATFRSAIAVAHLDIERLYRILCDEEVAEVRVRSTRIAIVDLADGDTEV